MKCRNSIALIIFIMCFCLMPHVGLAKSDSVNTYYKSVDGNTALSENFKVKEFACNDGSDKVLIDTELVDILQNIRKHFGTSVIITSGYRTPAYNYVVGGTKNSYHTKGMAADIVVSGVSPQEVAKYAEEIGVRGIGMYYSSKNGKFVHVDTRPQKYYWVNKGSGNTSVTTHGGEYNSDNTISIVPKQTKPTIDVTQYPETIPYGKSFGLRGTISSENSITSVNGYIINSSGTTVMSTTDYPNSKSMDIRPANLNQKMSFGNLASGKYTLRIIASDSSGGKAEWGYDFTVESDTANAGISNPDKNIQKGQSGEAVKELQRSLNTIMGAGLKVDGIFGSGTQKAVKEFQSKYGLTADGIAGPKTNAKINSLLK